VAHFADGHLMEHRVHNLPMEGVREMATILGKNIFAHFRLIYHLSPITPVASFICLWVFDNPRLPKDPLD